MLNDKQQRPWAESVHINFPNQEDKGANINVNGIVLIKYAPNRDSAVKLMEYLASNKAQAAYAEVNMEYPVNPAVSVSEAVASWGEFKADELPISKLSENYSTALRLLDEVRFDL